MLSKEGSAETGVALEAMARAGAKLSAQPSLYLMLQCRRLNCLAYVCLDYRHSTLENWNAVKRSLLADIFIKM